MKSVDDIPWIDSIPEDWDVYPIFHYFNENKIKNFGMIENNLLSLSYGKIIQKDIETSFGLLPESFETYQVLEDGYIVLRLTDLQNDKRSLRVGLVTQDGIITSAYVGLKKKRKVYSRYIYQLLHSYDLQKVFYNLGDGLRQSLRYEELKRLPILIPDYETQKQIADFLDRETTRIDTLITKKQKQIELLQEKRQAIITQSVTKGLNENVKMKDSGVEWIGEIPEHWEVRKFSQVISIQEGQVDPSIEPYKSVTLIAPNHIESKTGILLYTETAEEQGADSGKYLCREGDVVYSKIRPNLAKVVISPCDSLCSADMYPMRCDKKILENEFLYWLLLSDSYTRWAVLESMRVAMPKLNRETMCGYRIPVPPLNEQRELVSIIKDECLKISKIVEKIQGSINLLKEYRSSLITHAVSGQIDISKYEVSK